MIIVMKLIGNEILRNNAMSVWWPSTNTNTILNTQIESQTQEKQFGNITIAPRIQYRAFGEIWAYFMHRVMLKVLEKTEKIWIWAAKSHICIFISTILENFWKLF